MKDGELIEYYESGEISYKRNYINGKLHGETINYFTSGEIWFKSYFINGERVGELEWLCYFRNLTLELLGL